MFNVNGMKQRDRERGRETERERKEVHLTERIRRRIIGDHLLRILKSELAVT